MECEFINYFDLSKYIECVIDDNPNKIGLYMPGSKLYIYNSKALLEKNIGTCLLSLNPRNENKVIEKNSKFIKKGGRFYSIFSESTNALPLRGSHSPMEKVSNEVFIAKDKVVKINRDDTNFIRKQALDSLKNRSRICFHKDNKERIHEMILTLTKECYIRPHKHVDKSESFHMVEGEMDVLIFDDKGNIKQIIEMGDYSSNKNFYYRLSESVFHTVLIRSDYAIFHEVTNGPFDRKETRFAAWSPEEDDVSGISTFMNKINEFKSK